MAAKRLNEQFRAGSNARLCLIITLIAAPITLVQALKALMPQPSPPPYSLPEERQRRTLERLAESGRVRAAELAVEFGTSEHTIRRDLGELAARGLCQRVHGGALRLSPASAPALQRRDTQEPRKAALGRHAAQLVDAGQVVFIDAGSTNLAIARALPAELELTIVTNAPAIAEALAAQPHKQLILIGGLINARSGGTLGTMALAQLQLFRLDLCFLGACALDAESGLSCFDAEDAAFKRELVAASASVVVALTTEKLGTAAPYRVCALSALDTLVVEAEAPAAALHPFATLGIRIERPQS